MTSNYNTNSMSGILDVPNYFSVKNFLAYNSDRVNEGRTKQQINSAFATLDIDYDGFGLLMQRLEMTGSLQCPKRIDHTSIHQ